MGAVYSTEDGLLSFEVMGFAAGATTLGKLYDTLSSPDPGETVTYKYLGPKYLVVTGTAGYWRHYTLLMESDGHIAGYSVNWTDQYGDAANIAAVFAASYSMPLAAILSPNVTDPPTTPAVAPTRRSYGSQGMRVGAFVLPPEDATTIILDGVIDQNAPLDFRRALKERPDTRTLVLNSNGGLVVPALVVAHDVAGRSINTVVPQEAGCYSACAYVFFAGSARHVLGELGVHQMYGSGIELTAATTQMTLSDVLDALDEFGVPQQVISVMLRTPADSMHVFSSQEIAALGIDRDAERTATALASAERPRESSFIMLR